MLTLYTEIRPYTSYYLPVGDSHEIYVEESGNPRGLPVLVLHDGPGKGSESYLRQFFDPDDYRIIIFDQRGCGRSRPYAEIRENTTEHLINDMEKIREHLKIKNWLLFGGGWGSTLSLLYTVAHSKHVAGLILYNLFLCRQQDIDWLYREGASKVFCDYWQPFIESIPEKERENIVSAYHRRLMAKNELARMSAVKSWNLWQQNCMAKVEMKSRKNKTNSRAHFALASARIGCHYMQNKGFMPKKTILEQISKLKKIPTHLIHGRYNMVYLIDQMWQIQKALPKAETCIVNDASYSELAPSMVDALIHTTQQMVTSHGK